MLILSNRLKPKPDRPAIHLIKEYGSLPLVECYAVQINQVFMNVLTNAIDALEDAFVNKHLSPQCGREGEQINSGQIRIVTEVCPGKKAVLVRINDNGWGMTETVRQKIFEQIGRASCRERVYLAV